NDLAAHPHLAFATDIDPLAGVFPVAVRGGHAAQSINVVATHDDGDRDHADRMRDSRHSITVPTAAPPTASDHSECRCSREGRVSCGHSVRNWCENRRDSDTVMTMVADPRTALEQRFEALRGHMEIALVVQDPDADEVLDAAEALGD